MQLTLDRATTVRQADDLARPAAIRRRFVLPLAVALAVLLAGELAVRMVESRVPMPLRWYDAVAQVKVDQMDRLAAEGVDVVLAGTSQMLQGVDTAALAGRLPESRTAYNAGLVFGGPEIMQRWLLGEVVPRLRPSVVVWGLSSLDFNPSYAVEAVRSYDRAPAVRGGLLGSLERFVARHSAMVRLRSALREPATWKSALSGGAGDVERHAATLGPGGERLVYRADLSDDERREIADEVLGGYRVGEAETAALARTVQALESAGVAVVLVDMPVPSRYVGLHPDGSADFRRAQAHLERVAADLGVPLLRYAHAYPDELFADFTHLTRRGVERFSVDLAVALGALSL